MSLSSISLDAFYACAKIGHFTKAAEKLQITQSALSQRIQNLEKELKLTLFIRDRSGLRMTEAGEKLFRYCLSKESLEVEALTAMKANSKWLQSGDIRIGGGADVMRSLVLPRIKPLIKKRNLNLHFVIKEMRELPSLLQSGEIDFLIMDYALRREGIVHVVIGAEKKVLVQKKNYNGPDIYLDQNEEDETTFRFFNRKNSANLKRHFLGDIYGVIDGVRLGLGKAVVPRHLIANFSDIEVIEQKKSAENPLILHYYEQAYYSELHLEIIAALKKI